MSRIAVTASDISKDFNRRPIFRNISFSLSSPSSLAITGKNGSGKSTLSKIISGLMSLTKGSIIYSVDNTRSPVEKFKHYIGFVSPYLNLYDEFTAIENLQFLSRIRGFRELNDEKIKGLLTLVNLWQRRDDLVGTFSSGMKQRLKYAFALLHNPAMLILDEPTSNLDQEGVEVVERIVTKQKHEGILIVATNNKEEAAWCTNVIRLGERLEQ